MKSRIADSPRRRNFELTVKNPGPPENQQIVQNCFANGNPGLEHDVRASHGEILRGLTRAPASAPRMLDARKISHGSRGSEHDGAPHTGNVPAEHSQ